MVVTDLEHLPEQLKMNSAFERGIEFLRRQGWRNCEDGIIPIDGEQVYGVLQSYTTKIPQDSVLFEGHRKYIDLHYVIDGQEKIFWIPMAELAETSSYDSEKDVWLTQFNHAHASSIQLVAGQIVTLFPHDPHAPGYCMDDPKHVRKIVIKVLAQI